MNSGASATTDYISIDVQNICVELSITSSSVVALANNVETAPAEYQVFIGSGTQDFFFDSFTCSTGCLISYEVSPATAGLGAPAYDSSSGMMKISVADTTLTTYSF